MKKARVGFGRTELSLRLSCKEFCALSSGHGPRGLAFQGGGEGLDFHVFYFHFRPLKERPPGTSAANFALYNLGMVPGDKVLKGFAKPWIFKTFWDVKNAEEHENAG